MRQAREHRQVLAQRLKQLTLYAAAEGEGRGLDEATPADALDGWELVVTGHSLGGALATLPSPVLVGGADRRAIEVLLGTDRTSVTVKVARTDLDERVVAWRQMGLAGEAAPFAL